jgi:hypothetical protein
VESLTETGARLALDGGRDAFEGIRAQPPLLPEQTHVDVRARLELHQLAVWAVCLQVGHHSPSRDQGARSKATSGARASVLWFAALGFGASLLAPLLARAGAARCLDRFVAAVMTLTAVRVLIVARARL